jgi:hypothetical protein
MSSIATLNGVQYIVPAYNDTGWAQGAGNLSLYLAAIASATLQPTGGSFTLTADVDFGASFGLKALFLKTETANPASAGVIRLASADTIKWRNNANGADIALSKDSSDNLQYNATKVLLSGAVVNADINAAAAIAYSKLALTGTIVNADIASAAAIAVNKLAALTASKAMVTDASGFASAATVTVTELGYVAGVTSAIQTQLNGKQASGTYIANPLTGNLAAGGFKLTGLAAGSTAGDSARYEQVLLLAGGTMAGSIAFTDYSLQGITGTAASDSAPAGKVGEYISSVVTAGSAVSGSNGVFVNVTSISLTAGDWDVTGIIGFTLNGATMTVALGALSINTGNSTGDQVQGDNQTSSPLPTSNFNTSCALPAWRKSINGTTTIYMKAECDFSAGTPKVFGRLSARRVR